MPVFHILSEQNNAVYFLLNIVIVSLSYSSRYKYAIYWFFHCILVISMQNFFPSKVKQEMEFHFSSTLPVKSCKIASLSYTFRTKQCAVYLLLNIVTVSLSYKSRYTKLQVSYIHQAKLPVFSYTSRTIHCDVNKNHFLFQIPFPIWKRK